MVFSGDCFRWHLAAALVVGLGVPAIGWAGNRGTADAPPALEWIRGVPRGCRLISFEVRSRKSAPPLPGPRVDIVWSYATSENQDETAVLFRDVEILAFESTASSRIDGQIVRSTVALTPQQADRLQLAKVGGRLGVANAEGGLSLLGGGRTTWDIQAIEDRTEAIEARVASAAADAKRLERPTLASPRRLAAGAARRVINVPVEP